MCRHALCLTATRTIEKYGMLAEGDRVIVAVSGGPDSTALLACLVELTENLRLELNVWHLNHLIRPEAASEAAHVRTLADGFGVKSYVDEYDVKAFAKERKLPVQEAGRLVRYRLLNELETKIKADKIATAHNADDNAETFIINVMRGSGLRGLRGIPPTAGKVIRPLIECERSMITDYLAQRKIDYVIDSSNFDRRYLRNRVRLDLMPALKSIAPAIIGHLTTTTFLTREDEQFLDEMTQSCFQSAVSIENDEVVIDTGRLGLAPSALRRRVIRSVLRGLYHTDKNVDFATVAAIDELVFGRRGTINLRGGFKVAKADKNVYFYKPKKPFKKFEIGCKGGTIQIDRGRVSVTITAVTDKLMSSIAGGIGTRPKTYRTGRFRVEVRDKNWRTRPKTTDAGPTKPGVKVRRTPRMGFSATLIAVDADKIDWPLTIRSWQPGDWFVPLGMAGRKKLHDFFIDTKVAKHRRVGIPVFADREKIIAVGSLRIDERVKLSDRSRKAAILEVKLF